MKCIFFRVYQTNLIEYFNVEDLVNRKRHDPLVCLNLQTPEILYVYVVNL